MKLEALGTDFNFVDVCLIAVNENVAYRLEVSVSDYILCIACVFFIGFFCLQKQKIVEKGHFIDLSNEYKFTCAPARDKFVVKKKVFLATAVVLPFFPRK